jgi:hypothetical protein
VSGGKGRVRLVDILSDCVCSDALILGYRVQSGTIHAEKISAYGETSSFFGMAKSRYALRSDDAAGVTPASPVRHEQ